MKHATTPALGILMIELPKGATNIVVNKPRQVTPYFGIDWDMPDEGVCKIKEGFALSYKDFGGKKYYPKDIEYLSPFEAMTEEMFEKITPHIPEVVGYMDYRDNDNTGFSSARESFLSAVEASNFYFSNPYKKKYFNPEEYSEEEFELYEEAQSRTFDPALTHIFKIDK